MTTKEEVRSLLHTNREKIPQSAIGMIVRLTGLDDGSNIGLCAQMQRDLSIYPAFEAVLMTWDDLEEDVRERYIQAVKEYLGLSEGYLCGICGTRDPSRFGEDKGLCLGCISEGFCRHKCGHCGKEAVEGDTFGVWIFTAEGAEAYGYKEGEPVPEDIVQEVEPKDSDIEFELSYDLRRALLFIVKGA